MIKTNCDQYLNVVMQSYMPSSHCHFNDYGHNYDYVIMNVTINMTIGDYDYNYNYK